MLACCPVHSQPLLLYRVAARQSNDFFSPFFLGACCCTWRGFRPGHGPFHGVKQRRCIRGCNGMHYSSQQIASRGLFVNSLAYRSALFSLVALRATYLPLFHMQIRLTSGTAQLFPKLSSDMTLRQLRADVLAKYPRGLDVLSPRPPYDWQLLRLGS